MRPKGSGAYYACKIERISATHAAILMVLAAHPRERYTRSKIAYLLAKKGVHLKDDTISGRLSELLGLGYVSMTHERVRVLDKKSMTYRFVRKPLWQITEEGLKALREWILENA